MKFFFAIIYTLLLLIEPGCKEHQSIIVNHDDKNSPSVMNGNDIVEEAYTAHTLGCKAVLDSVKTGYINFQSNNYQDRIKSVIETVLSIHFNANITTSAMVG